MTSAWICRGVLSRSHGFVAGSFLAGSRDELESWLPVPTIRLGASTPLKFFFFFFLGHIFFVAIFLPDVTQWYVVLVESQLLGATITIMVVRVDLWEAAAAAHALAFDYVG